MRTKNPQVSKKVKVSTNNATASDKLRMLYDRSCNSFHNQSLKYLSDSKLKLHTKYWTLLLNPLPEYSSELIDHVLGIPEVSASKIVTFFNPNS